MLGVLDILLVASLNELRAFGCFCRVYNGELVGDYTNRKA